MAAPASPVLGFTVGARVICDGDHHLHLTLAYVGECDQARIQLLTEEIKKCAGKPIRLQLTEDDMFGPKSNPNIPVVKCKMLDPDVADWWRSFYERYSELEPGMEPPKPALQNYHISVKRPGSKAALRAMPKVVCQYVHLKRIGPHDPVAVVPLQRMLYDALVPDCQGEHPHCPCSDCECHHHK